VKNLRVGLEAQKLRCTDDKNELLYFSLDSVLIDLLDGPLLEGDHIGLYLIG
jgi:hypothetical protein